MIPAIAPFLERNFEIKKQPTQTYRMDMENRSVQGYTDGLEAMKQVENAPPQAGVSLPGAGFVCVVVI